MINKLIVWLFEKTEIGKLINGKKKYIGLVLSGWAGVAYLLAQLAAQFPEVGALGSAAAVVAGAFFAASKALAFLGVPLYLAGDFHDVVKESNEKK